MIHQALSAGIIKRYWHTLTAAGFQWGSQYCTFYGNSIEKLFIGGITRWESFGLRSGLNEYVINQGASSHGGQKHDKSNEPALQWCSQWENATTYIKAMTATRLTLCKTNITENTTVASLITSTTGEAQGNKHVPPPGPRWLYSLAGMSRF